MGSKYADIMQIAYVQQENYCGNVNAQKHPKATSTVELDMYSSIPTLGLFFFIHLPEQETCFVQMDSNGALAPLPHVSSFFHGHDDTVAGNPQYSYRIISCHYMIFLQYDHNSP